jgi:hypothetical protein
VRELYMYIATKKPYHALSCEHHNSVSYLRNKQVE